MGQYRHRLVAHVARLIRENAASGINVDELCRKLNASRSTLDRRMKAALKRSSKEEILRIRFREVERILRETDLIIDAILPVDLFNANAGRSSFRSPNALRR